MLQPRLLYYWASVADSGAKIKTALRTRKAASRLLPGATTASKRDVHVGPMPI